tara:strand:+ start:175 stop:366 length:192 start_codon:yes stop_codon:yes gene_type:complete
VGIRTYNLENVFFLISFAILSKSSILTLKILEIENKVRKNKINAKFHLKNENNIFPAYVLLGI